MPAPRSLQSLANTEGGHSFVEGENFADPSAELEAMGGDPFFLNDDNVIDVDTDVESGSEEDDDEEMAMPSSLLAGMAVASSGGVMDMIGKEEKWSATDGKGPAPKPPPPPRPENFSDRSAELEAMGGDPFFLNDDNVIDVESGSEEDADEEMAMPSSLLAGMAMASGGGVMDMIGKEEKWSATNGKGPAPKPPPPPRPDDWEWDGIVDENAHLDDF